MTTDDRPKQLADLVLSHSVNLQPDDKLLIQYDPKYFNYAEIIEKKAKQIGAQVKYDSKSYDPHSLRQLIKNNNPNEWNEELERRKSLSLWCNSRILIDCDSNPNYAKDLQDQEKRIAQFNKQVIGPYKKVLYRPNPQGNTLVKWNIVEFPCVESANKAGMSLEKYENLVYSATLLQDWDKMYKAMIQIKNIFDNAKDVHILVDKLTDLHLSLENRGAKICYGIRNMPDGEIYYGPVEDSVEGKIYFQCPTQRQGLGVIEGINLNFKAGKISDYSAEKNYNALKETLDIDEGAKRVGEFGIGTNYQIQNPIMNTLLDEKIGGTIHLALGNSFITNKLDSGGGYNQSDIHWDIICDLRRNESNLEKYPGGRIYVDGGLVQKNGIWQF